MIRRLVLVGAVLAAALTVGRVDAAFTAGAPNDANTGVAASVLAPTGFAVELVTNGGGGECTATLTWTAVSQTGVTALEVERVRTATNEVLAGPWTLAPAAVSTVDGGVPLQAVPQEWSWRIRARIGNWWSPWETASEPDGGACV